MKVVVPYKEKDSAVWDGFVSCAPMATFLHSRRFLSYHGDKFMDESLLIYDDEKNLIAVFPAAQSSTEKSQVISHPGATYGGLVHRGMMDGNDVLAILKEICAYYKQKKYKTLIYKAVPTFYHLVPSEEDRWALFALGAENYRNDLGRTINLRQKLVWGDKRQRGLKKSEKAGAVTDSGKKYAEELWRVTSENLEREHNAKPVHDLKDIKKLISLCPENIEYIVAKIEGEVIAGAMLFLTPNAVHVQYGSTSARGHDLSAVEMVYYRAIEWAKEVGKDYFSFGISNENEGRVLNPSLDRFKRKFSAGGSLYPFYRLEL